MLAALLGGLGGADRRPGRRQLRSRDHDLDQYLIPAFIAAVLGGMTSLPGAFVGGVLVGVVQSVATSAPIFEDIPGTKSTLVLFVVLLGVLLVRPQGLLGKRHLSDADRRTRHAAGRRGHAGASSAASAVPAVRRSAGPARGVLWLGVAYLVLLFPLDRPAGDLVTYTTAVCYGIVALSLNVLLGYVGQISLGHQAFVGVGAFASAYMVTVQGQSFWVGVLAAAAIGGGQALVLGGVSLRIRGLYFALVTLAYGLVAEQNIFQIQELTGGGAGQPAPKPELFDTDWRYYYLCLAFLALVLLVDWRMMRTKAGRSLLALRENPRVASTFGINVRAGHAVRLRGVRRVRRPRRRADRPQRHVRVAGRLELQPGAGVRHHDGGRRAAQPGRAGHRRRLLRPHAVPHREDPGVHRPARPRSPARRT